MENSVREILENLGYKITSETASYLKMPALYRSGDSLNALSVNKETGFWKDFVNSDSGPLEKLIKLTNGQEVSINIVSSNNLIRKLKEEIMPLIAEENVFPLLASYHFYNKRGISNDTLKHFESGLCTRGPLNDRIVFPIKKGSSIVGWAGRDVLNKPNRPKWKLMGQKKNWCYPLFCNKQDILDKKFVILVESIGDMLALYEVGVKNVLVLFGVVLSKEVLCSLVEMQLDKIVIATNNDCEKQTNVGKESAEKIKKQLEDWFSSSKIVIKLPLVNDFGADLEKTKEWYGELTGETGIFQ